MTTSFPMISSTPGMLFATQCSLRCIHDLYEEWDTCHEVAGGYEMLNRCMNRRALATGRYAP